jgi:hypothetical protein
MEEGLLSLGRVREMLVNQRQAVQVTELSL